MNKPKIIDVDSVIKLIDPQKYGLDYIRSILESTNTIGVNETVRKFGISKSTVRMWRNPGRNAKYMKHRYTTKTTDVLDYRKQRYIQNPQRAIDINNRSSKKRYHNDPDYRLRCLIRSRVWRAIKDQKGEKLLRLTEYLGCDIIHLRTHFESKFQPGMSWDSYGEWHIDHVKACSNFDLTNLEEQKTCFHYSNLQPLWAEDNLTKSNK